MTIKTKTPRTCILCGRTLSKVLTPTIRGGKKRRVFHCPSCDLGMLEGGFVNEAAAEDYYKGEYWKQHSPNIVHDTDAKNLFDTYVSLQEDRLRILRPYFSKRKRLIEIGCSAGMFLYHARKEMGEVVGVDYDAKAAAHASRVCRCTTYGTDIKNTPIEKGSVDILCAFQTLEHVVNPVEFLKTAGEYLAPRGVLAIEVPNLYDALESLYDLPNYHEFYYHDAHPWYFSEKSLLKAMRQAGFSGKVYFVQDYNVLNHLHWADTDEPKVGGVKQLSAPTLPFRKKSFPVAQREVLKHLRQFDALYKKTLVRHKIASNLFFVGRKKT